MSPSENRSRDPGLPPPSRLQLPPGDWATLFDGLCARFPRVDAERWRSRFARGLVQDADGRPLAMQQPWRVGQEIRYFREVDDEPPIAARERLLHADGELVVVDKPHGLPVMPAGRHVRETLLARLVAQLGNPQLVPLHRIDRATAGLVLFSANPASRAAYHGLFSGGRIDKTYLALAGPMPGRTWPFMHASRIAAGEPFPRMREVAGAPNSETLVEHAEPLGDGRWRYRLRPRTGRKHQLRVHMAALGAPIFGDDLYAPPEPPGLPLQLLAWRLRFIDPLDGRERQFTSSFQLGQD